jgi:general secretion pathway protein F
MFMLLMVAYVAVRMQLADPVRRLQWDAMLLKLPLVGDLVSKLEVASFARTLATLLGNGVTLLSALTIVKETLGNRAIAGKIDLAIDSLKQGGGLAAPVSEAGVFPIMAVQMIRLGEESGHLAEMLDRVATTYDKEIKTAVQRLLALMEPVLIIFLGIVIGGIIISILMAIVSVNDLAF